MGRKWSGTYTYHNVVSSYVDQTTTHGVRKISNSRHPVRRLFWTCVFLSSLSGCCYHCSYLITMYLSNPRVTVTEEIDADAVEFPSITICNLNIIKRSFADKYFKMVSNKQNTRKTSSCSRSEEDLASESAADLSDVWLNLAITSENISLFGHNLSDLLIQCTYNSFGCFTESNSFETKLTPFPSQVFGLCHILSLIDKKTKKPVIVKRAGTQNGIRMTINIEREKYWDLITPEYGVRILVHRQGTYPTLQRGGIIVSPGKSAHIGITRRVSTRVPGSEGVCTTSFSDSRVALKLDELGLNFDLTQIKYTYEYCNTLCQNAMLFEACNCSDLPPNVSEKGNWRYCNFCNKMESACRSSFLRNFTDAGNLCDELCKPSCYSVRYEISLSKADWPNFEHQQFVLNRSTEDWVNLPEAIGLLSLPFDEKNVTEFVNDTFFRENLLRAHLFIEDMIYISIQERFSYTLPKLLADLGGCLGLYLGVSVISIIELVELFGNASLVCLCRLKGFSKDRSSRFSQTRSGSRRKKRHRAGLNNISAFTTDLGPSMVHSRRNKQNNETAVWRPSFPGFDPYYQTENISRGNDLIRRF